jgi:hypothetical protein
MHFRLIQRLLWGYFILLLLITIRLSILVYQVSPLRKPIFDPYDGSSPWLTDGSENKILLAAMILASMLAINLALLIIPSDKLLRASSEWNLSESRLIIQNALLKQIKKLRFFLPYIIYYILEVVFISILIFPMLYLLFHAYLLSQWAID